MEQVLYELPEGWEWHKLAEAVEKTENLNPLKDTNKLWTYIDISSVDRNRFTITEPKEILGKDAPSRAKKQIQLNDVIFATTRPNLKNIALVRDEYKSPVASTGFCVLRANEKVLPAYLFYFVTTDFVQRQIEPYVGGASYPAITDGNLKKALIPIPSIDEQKRIVEKLDALLTRIDTAIEHLQESITLKSSLLQSALDGQFAAITDRMTIESLTEVKGGKRLPKGEKLSDEVTDHPYIRVADFTDKGTIDLSDIKYISKEIHEQIKRYVISKDDLYISIAGTIGKTGFVPPELDGANLTENAAKLVIKDKQQLDLSYLYLFTLTSDFSAQAGLATKTVAQPKLALTRLSKIEIPMCSLEEQKELVETIEALKSKTHNAEEVLLAKIEDLQSLKSSILDSAFKGLL
ncbi:restriction endonuclease subunit S [Thiomicrospira microaerophila]|uniref:restriction endonuclease subunit S n=1 Tax=Thiomicrospira microaerophila TaxID=406020 RepID=UPI00200D66AF|nr:restriction endonuclease subunit S [Thiomicrospira microaerophila]UQB42268.1 restriction endonuclease subunit S [Thiomicrospira microaerophila]